MSYNRINLFLRIDFFNIDIENIYAILVYKKYKKREQCSLLSKETYLILFSKFTFHNNSS